MATDPKYPVKPGPRPVERPVRVVVSGPPRSFKFFMIGVALLVAAVVIFIAIWLLTFGGGTQQQQQRPNPGSGGNGLPSTQTLPLTPRIHPQRPALYAWVK